MRMNTQIVLTLKLNVQFTRAVAIQNKKTLRYSFKTLKKKLFFFSKFSGEQFKHFMSPKIYKRSNHLRMISHFFTFFFVDSGFRFHCLDPFFLKFSYFHSKKACIQNFFEHELFQCFKNVLLVSLRISFIDYFTLYLSSEKTK